MKTIYINYTAKSGSQDVTIEREFRDGEYWFDDNSNSFIVKNHEGSVLVLREKLIELRSVVEQDASTK